MPLAYAPFFWVAVAYYTNGSRLRKKLLNSMKPVTQKCRCSVFYSFYGLSIQTCYYPYYLFNTANDCGSLSVPLNGSLSGNLTTYPNKVSFSCDEGFILRGSAVRQCQLNKQWSGNNSFCEGMF